MDELNMSDGNQINIRVIKNEKKGEYVLIWKIVMRIDVEEIWIKDEYNKYIKGWIV